MVRLGLVVASFNAPITNRMADAAQEAAVARGAEIIETIRVPGAYDTPLAADRLARRSDIDAVAVIGAIITGETRHDRVIGHTAARALTTVSLDRDTPVTLGIIGPGATAEDAHDRVDYGATAVDSAIDMVETLQ